MNRRKNTLAVAAVRCAIYTRKPTDEGLDQEFNTLDAQRESGEAYIASQRHEGWECVADHYDDGGFTGGNMERPALRRLMADIEAGKIDCVVVYKVDRLSRSLLNLARMMETVEHQSLLAVIAELDERGWVNKRWITRKGTDRGGKPFTKTSLHKLLANITYTGKLRYKDEVHDGEHEAIVSAELWQRVQTLLSRNGRTTALA